MPATASNTMYARVTTSETRRTLEVRSRALWLCVCILLQFKAAEGRVQGAAQSSRSGNKMNGSPLRLRLHRLLKLAKALGSLSPVRRIPFPPLSGFIAEFLIADLPQGPVTILHRLSVKLLVLDHLDQAGHCLHALRTGKHAAMGQATTGSINPHAECGIVMESLHQFRNRVVRTDIANCRNRAQTHRFLLGMCPGPQLAVDA